MTPPPPITACVLNTRSLTVVGKGDDQNLYMNINNFVTSETIPVKLSMTIQNLIDMNNAAIARSGYIWLRELRDRNLGLETDYDRPFQIDGDSLMMNRQSTLESCGIKENSLIYVTLRSH